MGQHPSLARPGARKNAQQIALVLDREALLSVQQLQAKIDAHRAKRYRSLPPASRVETPDTLPTMAFPQNYLHDGEDLILNLKPHWWTFARPVAWAVGAIVVMVLLMLTDITVLGWIGVVLLLAALVNLAIVYGKWATTYFVLSTERLIFRTGVLTKAGVEIPLDRINNVNFRQKLFERMIGAGDLLVESAGESGQSRFSDVRKPDAVQNEIYRQVESQRSRAMGTTPTVGSSSRQTGSIASQIEELDELRRKGLITQEEFDRKRRELLDRM